MRSPKAILAAAAVLTMALAIPSTALAATSASGAAARQGAITAHAAAASAHATRTPVPKRRIPIRQQVGHELKKATGRTGGCYDVFTITKSPVAAPLNHSLMRGASTYAWEYYSYDAALVGALDAWKYETKAVVANNGASAWLESSVSCWEDWAYGVSISSDPSLGGWCGAAQNGGGYYGYSYMNFGFNILVTAVVKGFPLSHIHWFRINVYNNGSSSDSGS
jgi:hypothetical protein